VFLLTFWDEGSIFYYLLGFLTYLWDEIVIRSEVYERHVRYSCMGRNINE